MAYNAALSDVLRGQKLELSIVDRSGKVVNFYAAEQALVEAVTAGAARCAEETRALAYEFCPVDTSFMRDNIVVVSSPNMQVFEIGWRADDFFAAGFDFYPVYVVLGTRFVAPRDPLTPAYEITKPLYEQLIRDEVGIALDKRRIA